MLKLTQGTADLLDMDTLVKASNMSISLERSQKLGTDWRDELEAAKQALIAVIERGQKTARYVCKGSEMSAINLMMEIHDAQLDNATVSMLEKALPSPFTFTNRSCYELRRCRDESFAVG